PPPSDAKSSTCRPESPPAPAVSPCTCRRHGHGTAPGPPCSPPAADHPPPPPADHPRPTHPPHQDQTSPSKIHPRTTGGSGLNVIIATQGADLRSGRTVPGT